VTAIALLLGVFLLGTGGTAAGTTPWKALHRPLVLKPLAAGAACPVSAPHPLDHGRLSGAGKGPIYTFPSRLDPYDRHPEWLGSKTLWAWPTALIARGERVLVRGRRLDEPGTMGFQLGPQWDTAPLTAELRVDTSQTVGSFSVSRWGTTVTMLLVRAPGCYGLQLDSARGTSTIVLRAAEQ
jgi:hypothetical protein